MLCAKGEHEPAPEARGQLGWLSFPGAMGRSVMLTPVSPQSEDFDIYTLYCMNYPR